MKYVSLGFYIRRTWREPVPVGKTISAHAHRIFATMDDAREALHFDEAHGLTDRRYDYDISEVFTRVEEG